MKTTTGLFIFRDDLRLTDNVAFNALAARCDQLLCVYIVDERWFQYNQYGCQAIGKHRQRFLCETLRDLGQSLNQREQQLHVIEGDFHQVLAGLIKSVLPTIVGINQYCGWHEQQAEKQLASLCSENDIELVLAPEQSLLVHTELPFSVDEMPDVFSPFRRKVEKTDVIRRPSKLADQIAPSLSGFDYKFDLDRLIDTAKTSTSAQLSPWERLTGGESSATKQLDYYLFETDLIAQYKETRNQLDGWDFSSKLSAWLANGSLSAATVAEKVSQYEQRRVQNDSTYWLIFELLWREFFHLQSYKQGVKLFAFQGIQEKKPSTKFDQELFQQWCLGETGYAIVDACMRQLNATGFMSNRGRQLVASCFVHELNLDWRYGAAYFEQQLIDFDVASNWGNWQYLAGVGTDPRGHRQFNLDKQTEIYDPDHSFISHWL